METIDLVATATQILELLSDQGISGKSLHAYTHTGIGCVIRHFQAKGILCAAPEMLDAFLLEQREFFDQGAFSVWKWRLLRRGCELLKHCAEKGSVDLPPLSPWMPALRRPRQSIWKDTPTPEQLADLDNIYALVWRTNSAMLELGLTDATVGHYRNEGLAIILNRHYESGTDRFSGEILDQIVAEKRIQYEYGQIGRGSYQNLRKAAYWIQEMHQTGHITLAKVPNWGQRELVEPFNSLLREFCTHTKQSESMAETTRNVARSAIRRFLFEMEDHGFRSLADFTLINVNGCVTSFAAHYAGGLGSAIFSVRLFLRFLFERNLTITDLSQSLPELMATRKMFHEGFTEDELEYLLEHPDRTTAIGKRDYAMMVLAAQSGLRACDVVRLELGSIDWRAREIRLVQHKTGEPLSLPLEAESGNAIADYILNGRPDSALPNIFLCHTGVIRPLDARSASGVVSKHMKLAGIPAKRRAFHALRRTFGTRLLQNEVSFELIQQLLGHRDMDSMKLYLSIDEQGLKQCAFHTTADYHSEAPLFFTVIHGTQQKMSPDTVSAFFIKYGSMAKLVCPEVPEHIHPHMMRHTRAMHLYQSGMPMVLLSQYLGHAQVETTMIYAHADTEMKRAAIQKADAVRKAKPAPDEIWADNEEMILKLSGLT